MVTETAIAHHVNGPNFQTASELSSLIQLFYKANLTLADDQDVIKYQLLHIKKR